MRSNFASTKLDPTTSTLLERLKEIINGSPKDVQQLNTLHAQEDGDASKVQAMCGEGGETLGDA